MSMSTVIELLGQCTVGDKVVYLPKWQLRQEEYQAIKKQLEFIGGSWSTSSQGFAFKHDPSERIQQILDGRDIRLKRDYQFFETPNWLISLLMLQLQQVAYFDFDEVIRALEPSAGRGNILKYMNNSYHHKDLDIHYCEIMPENIETLRNLNIGLHVAEDFLTYNPDTPYDFVMANPPFNKNQDITHIKHMWDVTKNGGFVASIAYEKTIDNKEFEEWLTANTYAWSMEDYKPSDFDEKEIFSGTKVGCTFVCFKVKKL